MRTLIALLALALGFSAAAQTYPNQPVRMISPFPPGGSVDITAPEEAGKFIASEVPRFARLIKARGITAN